MKPLLLSTLLALSLVAPASAASRLSASSNTAISITGDVTVAAGKITFGNGKSVALRKIASEPQIPVADATLMPRTALC